MALLFSAIVGISPRNSYVRKVEDFLF